MNVLKKLVLILVVAAAAWAQEHRGLFFSAGLGFSYASLFYTDVEYNYGSGAYFENQWVSSYEEGPKSTWDLNSFEIPTIDIRLGCSFANLFAVYVLFSGGAYSGEFDYTREKVGVSRYLEDDGSIAVEPKQVEPPVKQEHETMYARFSLGLGFSVYPIRNPLSRLNGLYVGFAGGLDAWAVHMKSGLDSFDNSGIFTRYEIGKDWWMSESWSLGVGFAFTNVFKFIKDYEGNDEGHARVFSLLFRITRG
ncbi:MAG: hypothetical protein II565_10735 [Fibrobacter sp.]|nr:hypothetical protein [Fibrobacter sp.]